MEAENAFCIKIISAAQHDAWLNHFIFQNENANKRIVIVRLDTQDYDAQWHYISYRIISA